MGCKLPDSLSYVRLFVLSECKDMSNEITKQTIYLILTNINFYSYGK